jgi:hypothetical protein
MPCIQKFSKIQKSQHKSKQSRKKYCSIKLNHQTVHNYIIEHNPKIVLEKVSIPEEIHSPTPEVPDDEPEVIDDESSPETVVIDSENENEDTNGLGEDSETESNIVIVPTVYKNDALKPKSKLKPKSRDIWWCSPKKGNKTFNYFVFNLKYQLIRFKCSYILIDVN